MISFVWIFSFVFTLPVAFTSQLQPLGESGRNKCREVWPSQFGELSFNLLLDLILLMIPLFTMMTIYFKIGRALWQHIVKEREPDSITYSHNSSVESTKGQSGTLTTINKNVSSRKSKTFSRRLQKDLDATDDDSMVVESLEDGRLEISGEVRGITLKVDEEKVEWEKYPMKPKHIRPNCNLHLQSKGNLQEKSILRKNNAKKSLQLKKRVIKMLFVVVLEFFVCWTPLYVINTISVYSPSAIYSTLGMEGVSSFQLLAYCSCCCNPITYCFMNVSFRRAFLSAVGCRKAPKGSEENMR